MFAFAAIGASYELLRERARKGSNEDLFRVAVKILGLPYGLASGIVRIGWDYKFILASKNKITATCASCVLMRRWSTISSAQATASWVSPPMSRSPISRMSLSSMRVSIAHPTLTSPDRNWRLRER